MTGTKYQKTVYRNSIMKHISKTYKQKSGAYAIVYKALGKLSLSELDSLQIMLTTSINRRATSWNQTELQSRITRN